MSSDIVGSDDFLGELKTRISSAQLRAAIALNKDLYSSTGLGDIFSSVNNSKDGARR
jgi:hypothetical protein